MRALVLHDVFVRTMIARSFVREVLGCTCPDEVFDDVRIGLPVLFGTHDVEGGLEILVGRRLLIAVVPLAGMNDAIGDAQAILARGRAVRDDRGLSRYRLALVGAPDGSTLDILEALSTTLDEKTHLHVVDADLLTKLTEAG